MATTIIDEIARIAAAKGEIRNAINAKGGEVATDATIDTYPQAINALPVVDSPYMQSVAEGDIADANISFVKLLKKVRLPQGCSIVAASTFAGAENLEDVENLEGITTLNAMAFMGTAALRKELNLPILQTVAQGIFANSGITKILSLGALVNLVGYTSTYTYGAFQGCLNLEEVALPQSLKTLGAQSFYACTKLRRVTTCKVEVYGSYSFYNCINLLDIDLTSAMQIGDYAFMNAALTDKILNLPNLTSIGVAAFRNTDIKKVISLGSVLEIAGGTSGNNYGAFYGCTNLEEMTLPAGLKIIGANAFNGNTQMQLTAGIPESVAVIRTLAFYTCRALTEDINLPNLTTLEARAFESSGVIKVSNLGKITTLLGAASQGVFRSCTNLEEITLPATLTTIQQQAAYGCSRLTTITCLATTPPSLANTNAFGGCPLEHIYVPAESVETYKAATNWSSFANIIEAIPNA